MNRSWQSYDEAPSSDFVRPVRVIGVRGNVANPQGLAGSGQTTLTYISGGTQPSIVLDFGKEVSGKATYDIAESTNTTLRATYSEALYNLGDDGALSVIAFNSGTANRSEDYSLLGPGSVTSPVIQGGERYVQLTLSSPGTVTLSGAGIAFAPPRVTPDLMRGSFLSSDDRLNRIWWDGVYTLNLNQFAPGLEVLPGDNDDKHLLVDGPKRDRAVWSGDHLIADLTDFYASDPVYARDSLAVLLEHPATVATLLTPTSGDLSQPGPLPGACSPNPATGNACRTWSASYSMAVIPALYNYYLYTGDLGFVRSHWQAVLRSLQWANQLVTSSGLVEVSQDIGADWNTDKTSGQLTYVNALYRLALDSAAKLADALGDRALAKTYLSQSRGIRAAVNRNLWDSRTGLYDASTSERGFAIQDANVTAILAGIPKLRRSRGILRRVGTALASQYGPLTVGSPVPPGRSQWVSPYMGSFHVLAAFAAGAENAALSLIRQEWGYMTDNDPGGVMWERIQPNGRLAPGAIADSAAHAWSSGPTAAMSKYLVGVTPVAPGFRTWRIAPQPGGIRFVQGRVPTPRGSIDVRWRQKKNRFVLTVRVPKGTSGTVVVPFGRRGIIARNGRIVWSRGKTIGGVRAKSMEHSILFRKVHSSGTYVWIK